MGRRDAREIGLARWRAEVGPPAGVDWRVAERHSVGDRHPTREIDDSERVHPEREPVRRILMRFLVLLGGVGHFDNWDAAGDELRARYFRDYRAFADAVRRRGDLVVGDALTRPESARCVQPGAARLVSAGPFAETAEQIGGFYVIDLPDFETAVELAKLLPQEHRVEIRPALGIQV
jgi:hypothetical protein